MKTSTNPIANHKKSKAQQGRLSKPGSLILTRSKRILRQHLPEVQKRYCVKSLGIFGSYVRGKQKPKSDLDVLVKFETAPSLFQYVELENYLSELVGIKVDLVHRKTLKPAIGQRILAEVVPL